MDDRHIIKAYFVSTEALVFRLAKSMVFRFYSFSHIWSLIVLILAAVTGAVGILGNPFNWPRNIFLGSISVMLGIGLFFLLLKLFFVTKIARMQGGPTLSQAMSLGGNLAEFFDFQTAGLLIDITKEGKPIKPLELSRALVKKAPGINFILTRMGLNGSVLGKRIGLEMERNIWTDQELTLYDVIVTAAERALSNQRESINSNDLLWASFKLDLFLNEILIEQELAIEDVDNIFNWYERLEKEEAKSRRFWDYNNLMQKGSLARHWAAAYTLTIDTYSRDITGIVRKRESRAAAFGHDDELEHIENVLAGSGHNNVLLVGEPGSGRIELVESLAARFFWNKSLPSLNSKRVMELDLPTIIARAPSIEEVEAILDTCFQEAIAMSNVILVIRDLENFVTATKVGTVDISSLLSKYLESPKFQIIAIASFAGLHKDIQKLPALLNLFNKVEISPPSPHQALKILEYSVAEFEQRYGKFIPYLTLKRIIERSARYLQDKPFPKKAIDLLDEVMVYASRQSGINYVSSDLVDQVISRRAEVPIGRIQSSEKEMLLNLENLIHEKVINQEEAVREVSAALRRARAEVTTKRMKPMGSFLFLGPTGVGKTETAKALTSIYFGSEQKMVRIDMSEFQDARDIYRLIGGESNSGLLTTQIRENPFSLLLIDEIEKAHPDILNLFLTILDEGYITDGFGQKVTFSDNIIVATSNAGAEIIRRDIEEDMSLNIIKDELLDHLMQEKYFRPELINRFTGIIVFKTLTHEHLLSIAKLMFKKLADALTEKGITLETDQALAQKIVELSYRPAFGAREMERVINDRIANVLAQAILKDEIKRGDRVRVDAEDFCVRIISA